MSWHGYSSSTGYSEWKCEKCLLAIPFREIPYERLAPHERWYENTWLEIVCEECIVESAAEDMINGTTDWNKEKIPPRD